MRGTDRDRLCVVEQTRFSPAHAGNSRSAPGYASTGSVQPRACGEQMAGGVDGSVSTGSAPRMRGTVRPLRPGPIEQRFSPAHAGNSSGAAITLESPSVQPRACGEQSIAARTAAVFGGSAPRMRGTGDRGLTSSGPSRFSPAHAGNRQILRADDRGYPVQPRACGEQDALDAMARDAGGSAPRMRGTGRSGARTDRADRFSPAHAGNSRA